MKIVQFEDVVEIDKELENVEESVRVGDNVGERGEVI